jgi:hypothetical protein
MAVKNSAGAVVCKYVSSTVLTDGADHVAFAAFDGDAGTAVLYVDGVDEDDTGNAERVAPSIQTLATSTGNSTAVASASATAASFPFGGNIGYCGYRDAYLTNYTDFMDGSSPKQLDESGWTEWGAQPASWNAEGTMTVNNGSDGNYTSNGTITGPA